MGYDPADKPETGGRIETGREPDEYLLRHIALRGGLRGKASYRLSREGGRLTLTVSLPATLRGKPRVLEFTDDVTGRFSFDSIPEDRQARKAVFTDELTGLYNRRFIDRALSEMLSGPGEPFTLMMADIDRFKSINDTFGHVAGDRVLRRFAELLLGRIRKGRDWAARYGGDEFLICLKEAKRESAFRAAERIRRAAMQQAFPCGEAVIRLTCSVGVYRESESAEELSVENLIELVDGRLYQAKKSGRNRTVMK